MLRLLLVTLLATACVALPLLDGKIVGGEPVDIENYPYQVSLVKSGSHACGGSIISNEWILTAAHCVSGSVSSMKIRAGSSIKNSGGVLVQVAEKFVNPQYNTPIQFDYDLCLLKLEEPLTFGPGIGPIGLPTQGEMVDAGTPSDVSGWGALTEGGGSPSQLQSVKVPVVEKAECQDSYGTSSITDRMICAGVPAGGLDSCQGDSGGPMVAGGKLVGVVSWGRGCARPGYPGVYSRVASMRDWVSQTSGV